MREHSLGLLLGRMSLNAENLVEIGTGTEDYISSWSFEISEGILRNQKSVVGLDTFSNQDLIYLVPFEYY